MMRTLRVLVCIVVWPLIPDLAKGQEMEPYAYAPNPVGLNFFFAGYGETWGEILFDPSLQITDVDASWHNLTAGYGRTFGLAGRQSNFTMVFPYVAGDVSGSVDEVFTEVSRTGMADPRFLLSINLLGGPAMSPAEFAKYKQRTTLGMKFIIAPPTGRYFPDKLINIGSNRWSFKSELGVSSPVGKWRFELAAGVWVFSDNNDFFGGHVRSQNPITTFQGHAIYTFRPRFWVAVNANWFRGGTSEVDGIANADLQSTSRFGLTASYPLNAKQSLKLAYSDGATTRIGGDYQNLSLTWQYIWF